MSSDGGQETLSAQASETRSACAARWAGAGLVLASALIASVPLFCLGALTMAEPYLGGYVLFFLGYTVPPFQLVIWAASVGGIRFFLRMILGWVFGVGVFLMIFFWLVKIVPDPGSITMLNWRHFCIIGSAGGLGMACWAICLGRWKLVLPFFVTGLFYPFTFAFSRHWEESLEPGGSQMIDSTLWAAGLVLPILVFAPWIGSRVPLTRSRGPVLPKNCVITMSAIMGCIILGLGWLYSTQRLSALQIVERPLQTAPASQPGEVLWRVPIYQDLLSRPMLTTNGSGQVIAFFGGDIYVIDEKRGTYSQMTGHWYGIGAADLSPAGTLYFSCNGYLFAWRDGRKIWSWPSEDRYRDVLIEPDESVTFIGEAEAVHLDRNGAKSWSCRNPKEYSFVRAFRDPTGMKYIINWSAYVVALDGHGQQLWAKESVAGERYIGASFYTHAQTAGMMTKPAPLLAIGSTNGVMAFNQRGQTEFYSLEPFELFGCDGDFCCGVVEKREVHRIRFDGSRSVIYRSSEPILDCLLEPAEQKIYLLNKSQIVQLRLNGEIEEILSVPREVKLLSAVHSDRIYARTGTKLVAISRALHRSTQ